MSIRESRLYRDQDHRDAMYGAMTYIACQGGPPLPGDTNEVLAAYREHARGWLLAQEDPNDLLSSYELFVQIWSPVFLD